MINQSNTDISSVVQHPFKICWEKKRGYLKGHMGGIKMFMKLLHYT